ncbi:MAG: PIN domain-containing protein [Actinomycetota bacterium]
MTLSLLDANLLVALLSPTHQHHALAMRWFGEVERLATCTIIEMSFLRFAHRNGVAVADAVRSIDRLSNVRGHEFWNDDVRPSARSMQGVIGHRQVAAFHLVALARRHGGRLATFDRGVAAAHPDVVDLGPA